MRFGIDCSIFPKIYVVEIAKFVQILARRLYRVTAVLRLPGVAMMHGEALARMLLNVSRVRQGFTLLVTFNVDSASISRYSLIRTLATAGTPGAIGISQLGYFYIVTYRL